MATSNSGEYATELDPAHADLVPQEGRCLSRSVTDKYGWTNESVAISQRINIVADGDSGSVMYGRVLGILLRDVLNRIETRIYQSWRNHSVAPLEDIQRGGTHVFLSGSRWLEESQLDLSRVILPDVVWIKESGLEGKTSLYSSELAWTSQGILQVNLGSLPSDTDVMNSPPLSGVSGKPYCTNVTSSMCSDGRFIPSVCKQGAACTQIWTSYFSLTNGRLEQFIEKSGWPVVVVYMGDQLDSKISASLAANVKFVVVMNTLEKVHNKHKGQLTAVSLSNMYTKQCQVKYLSAAWDCDFPTLQMQTFSYPGFAHTARTAHRLLKEAIMVQSDMDGLLSASLTSGESTVACNWVLNNENQWKGWVQIRGELTSEISVGSILPMSGEHFFVTEQIILGYTSALLATSPNFQEINVNSTGIRAYNYDSLLYNNRLQDAVVDLVENRRVDFIFSAFEDVKDEVSVISQATRYGIASQLAFSSSRSTANRNAFPYVVKSYPALTSFIDPLLALIGHFGWRRVAYVVSEAEETVVMGTSFAERARVVGIEVNAQALVYRKGLGRVFENIRSQTNFAIVCLFLTSLDFVDALEEIKEGGLFDKNYQLITTAFTFTPFTYPRIQNSTKLRPRDMDGLLSVDLYVNTTASLYELMKGSSELYTGKPTPDNYIAPQFTATSFDGSFASAHSFVNAFRVISNLGLPSECLFAFQLGPSVCSLNATFAQELYDQVACINRYAGKNCTNSMPGVRDFLDYGRFSDTETFGPNSRNPFALVLFEYYNQKFAGTSGNYSVDETTGERIVDSFYIVNGFATLAPTDDLSVLHTDLGANALNLIGVYRRGESRNKLIFTKEPKFWASSMDQMQVVPPVDTRVVDFCKDSPHRAFYLDDLELYYAQYGNWLIVAHILINFISVSVVTFSIWSTRTKSTAHSLPASDCYPQEVALNFPNFVAVAAQALVSIQYMRTILGARFSWKNEEDGMFMRIFSLLGFIDVTPGESTFNYYFSLVLMTIWLLYAMAVMNETVEKWVMSTTLGEVLMKPAIYYLDMVNNLLYFPIMRAVVAIFNCPMHPDNLVCYNISYCAMGCWTESHMAIAVTGLVIYLPFIHYSLRMIMLWQRLAKDLQIIFEPKYLLYTGGFKVYFSYLYLMTRTFATAILSVNAVIFSALLAYTWINRPCVIKWVNDVVMFSIVAQLTSTVILSGFQLSGTTDGETVVLTIFLAYVALSVMLVWRIKSKYTVLFESQTDITLAAVRNAIKQDNKQSLAALHMARSFHNISDDGAHQLQQIYDIVAISRPMEKALGTEKYARLLEDLKSGSQSLEYLYEISKVSHSNEESFTLFFISAILCSVNLTSERETNKLIAALVDEISNIMHTKRSSHAYQLRHFRVYPHPDHGLLDHHHILEQHKTNIYNDIECVEVQEEKEEEGKEEEKEEEEEEEEEEEGEVQELDSDIPDTKEENSEMDSYNISAIRGIKEISNVDK
eukprot:Nk52_evm14s228 gene=Nk52_evmTU14s228